MPHDRTSILSSIISNDCSVDEAMGEIRDWLAEQNLPCLRHPHGFYVALLARDDDEEWRFHLWPKEQRIITGMPAFIHTHDCHVASRVLAGRLTNITYEAIEVPIGGAPLYRVGYSADRYLGDTKNWIEKLVTCSPEM
ncbi:hypothetical protein ACT17R_16635 [Sphingopyxis sp. Q841]|uniref:hypothetical protein n=1 Tax=Sphingopyxis sp. Q841 TaxID=3458250 RepID=UPI0040371A92